MGFLVICFGITILQMSKVDPEKLNKLDRRSTLLLQAARLQAGHLNEKTGMPSEDPGIDALRGSFGTVGSIVRARTLRMSQNSQNTSHIRMRPTGAAAPYDPAGNTYQLDPVYPNMLRHQLYDPPVPRDDTSSIRGSVVSQSNKRPTIIKFDSQDVVHSYKRPGTGDNTATHEHRQAQGSTPLTTENDGEADLFTTSPTMSRTITAPPVIPRIPPPQTGQLLNIPPLIANEHTVQSAPAVIQGHFSHSDIPTPTQGDLFDSTSGRETLLSFPSVTDSAPSEWEAANVGKEAANVGREAANVGREPHHMRKEKSRERLKSPKRYPRGSADDDEEESEILFRKGTISSEGDDNTSTTPPPDVSGVRLVSVNQRQYF